VTNPIFNYILPPADVSATPDDTRSLLCMVNFKDWKGICRPLLLDAILTYTWKDWGKQ